MEEVQKQRKRRTVTTIVVVAILIAVIVGGIYAFTSRPGSGGLPAYLDVCVSGSGRFYHAHPRLSIMISGNPRTVDSGIGIEGGCLRPLHTHSADGVIHVEPDDGSHPDYTLGDFFVIWKKVLNSTQILEFKADSTNRITLTVNGAEVLGLPENYQIPRNAGTSSEPCSPGPSCQPVDMIITYGPSAS